MKNIISYLHDRFPRIIPVMTCNACLKDNCANRNYFNRRCKGFKKQELDYRKFLYQARYAKERRHLLTEQEVHKYFISKIDRNKFHVSIDCCIKYGKFIDDYNWEVAIYKLITDEKGNIKKEYWDKSNVALVNSKYMTEEQLYLALYNLMEH